MNHGHSHGGNGHDHGHSHGSPMAFPPGAQLPPGMALPPGYQRLLQRANQPVTSEPTDITNLPVGALNAEIQGMLPLDASLFDAVKQGKLDALKKIVESNGSDCLKKAIDPIKGYTLVHWAAIGGHLPILEYLMEQGLSLTSETDLPADDSNPAVRQQPIHLASVTGQVGVIDWLVRNGVDINSGDSKGVTPLIVAAQCNQLHLLTYFLAKGVNTKARDREGDGPLQWAAFKGNTAIVRMLLDLGFDPLERDSFNQTALHLASIKGHMDVLKELMKQNGMKQVLNWADKNGRTPVNLAENRGHHQIVSFYKTVGRTNLSIYTAITSVILGPPERQRFALYFFILNFLLFCYPVYFGLVIPITWEEMKNAHILYISINIFMWITYLKSMFTDPGFVATNSADYDLAMKRLASPAFDWSRLKPDVQSHFALAPRNPLARLCHTCRIVKPLRSKHCRICGRCVRNADHHCPWVNNCIGMKNRGWFYAYILAMTAMEIWVIWIGFELNARGAITFLIGLCIADVVLFGVAIFLICIIQALNMWENLSTNERFNWRRYPHFVKSDGSYINPFSRSPLSNILEYFGFIRERTILTVEDELFSSNGMSTV